MSSFPWRFHGFEEEVKPRVPPAPIETEEEEPETLEEQQEELQEDFDWSKVPGPVSPSFQKAWQEGISKCSNLDFNDFNRTKGWEPFS